MKFSYTVLRGEYLGLPISIKSMIGSKNILRFRQLLDQKVPTIYILGKWDSALARLINESFL